MFLYLINNHALCAQKNPTYLELKLIFLLEERKIKAALLYTQATSKIGISAWPKQPWDRRSFRSSRNTDF
jgi:hypothetical protein